MWSNARGFAIVPIILIIGLAAGGVTWLVKSHHRVTVDELLVAAQFGIEADCAIGTDALAKEICLWGTDALPAARAALAKDPVAGRAAAKQLLLDGEAQYPALTPYVQFVVTKL
jgi:hypothetical protein